MAQRTWTPLKPEIKARAAATPVEPAADEPGPSLRPRIAVCPFEQLMGLRHGAEQQRAKSPDADGPTGRD